jgi:hypothetical protein
MCCRLAVLMAVLGVLGGCSTSDGLDRVTDASPRFISVTRFSDFRKAIDVRSGETILTSSELNTSLLWDELVVSWNASLPTGAAEQGDVLVNDPWAALEKGEKVLQIVPRLNLLKAWARSRQTVYLIYPEDWAVPKSRWDRW